MGRMDRKTALYLNFEFIFTLPIPYIYYCTLRIGLLLEQTCERVHFVVSFLSIFICFCFVSGN